MNINLTRKLIVFVQFERINLINLLLGEWHCLRVRYHRGSYFLTKVANLRMTVCKLCIGKHSSPHLSPAIIFDGTISSYIKTLHGKVSINFDDKINRM